MSGGSFTSPTRRNVVLGGALAAASATAFALQPRAAPTGSSIPLSNAVPRQIGHFHEIAPEGFVLPAAGPLTERTYVDLMTRLYVAEGAPPVMLLVAQGRVNDPGMSVHRPESCYRSAGFGIENDGIVPLPAPFPSHAEAVRLTARREDRVEQVFFWTRIGTRFPATARAQRLITLRENLVGILPPGLLFRLSVIGDDATAAFDLLYRFNATLLSQLSGSARAALLG